MPLISSFAAVCAELDRRLFVTMGLDRIGSLLALLGNPQEKLRIVQVVGTNGKGTTAVALAAALSRPGQPAGTYLSPHVLSYTERVMVGGRYVSEEASPPRWTGRWRPPTVTTYRPPKWSRRAALRVLTVRARRGE